MGKTSEAGASAYDVFVERLMSLCTEKGTFADACRATGINRQQFNRYLSGKYLPSPENLRKIAAYLEVESPDLFTLPGRKARSRTSAEADLEMPGLPGTRIATPKATVPCTGLYWMFVPSMLHEGKVLISFMTIYAENDRLVMRGARRLGAPRQVNLGDRPVHLKGMVSQSGSRTSVLYTETHGISGLRMLNFDAGDMSKRTFYSGILSTFLPSGSPVAYPALLQLLDTDLSNWRSYYRAAGYIPYDHGAVDRRSAQALKFLRELSQHSLLAPRLPERVIQQLTI